MSEAAEGVEQRGAHARVHAVAVGDVARHRAHGDKGDGVVSRAEVGKDDEQGNGQLGSALAIDATGEHTDEPVDAAIVAYQGKHAACEEGDDDEFAHAHNALTHGAHPSHKVEVATSHTDDARKHDTDEEHHEHVHPRGGKHQYRHVGEHLVPLRPSHIGGGLHALSQDDIEHEGHEGCGTGKVDVGLELIAHAYALRLRGHDGGIGDEGEVVAKEGASHHDGYDEGK